MLGMRRLAVGLLAWLLATMVVGSALRAAGWDDSSWWGWFVAYLVVGGIAGAALYGWLVPTPRRRT
jgi:hypothetical protein